MSIDTANAARKAKGMTVLTELEGELLEELEMALDYFGNTPCRDDCNHQICRIERRIQARIQKAHGAEKGGE